MCFLIPLPLLHFLSFPPLTHFSLLLPIHLLHVPQPCCSIFILLNTIYRSSLIQVTTRSPIFMSFEKLLPLLNTYFVPTFAVLTHIVMSERLSISIPFYFFDFLSLSLTCILLICAYQTIPIPIKPLLSSNGSNACVYVQKLLWVGLCTVVISGDYKTGSMMQ